MKKRVIFMGTPSYATDIFKSLLNSDFDVVALFTQQDKPVGRKQIITPPHIKQYCLDNSLNIPIFQPKKLKDDSSIVEKIEELKADFIVVAAYGQILPKEILNLAPCINLHASLLPLYRGASPIQEAILNDNSFTGVTAMLMDEGLDTGDILGYKYQKISSNTKVDELFLQLSNIASTLTIDILERFDNLNPLKQNSSMASLCRKIKKDDGVVSFTNAKDIFLKYRAYFSWPGISTVNGLKLKEIELFETNSSNKKGEVLDIQKEFIIVGCNKGAIKIKTLQMPSKNALSVDDFLRGNQTIKVGSILEEELFQK